jgi:WD40 repeat protein
VSAPLSFSPDGKLLASASGSDWWRDSKGIYIWETSSGKEISTLRGQTRGILSVAFRPDGKVLAGGSFDGRIRIWEIPSGQEISTFNAHKDDIHSVVFSPDGKVLASGGVDGAIRFWEAPPTSSREISTPSAIHSLVFSPDGKVLASCGEDRKVRIWEITSGHEISTFGTNNPDVLKSLAFSPDGSLLAHGPWRIHIRKTTSWEQIATLKGSMNTVLSVVFSPNGKLLASASGGSFPEEKRIRIWETTTWRKISSLGGNMASIESLAFSPDGKQLASGSEDGSVRLWEWDRSRFCLAWVRNGTAGLRAKEANIEGAIGLSPTNRRLLQQHGAQKKKTNKTGKRRPVEGRYVPGHQLHHYLFASRDDADALVKALQATSTLPGNQYLKVTVGMPGSEYEGQWLVKLNAKQRQHARESFGHLLPADVYLN